MNQHFKIRVPAWALKKGIELALSAAMGDASVGDWSHEAGQLQTVAFDKVNPRQLIEVRSDAWYVKHIPDWKPSEVPIDDIAKDVLADPFAPLVGEEWRRPDTAGEVSGIDWAVQDEGGGQ